MRATTYWGIFLSLFLVLSFRGSNKVVCLRLDKLQLFAINSCFRYLVVVVSIKTTVNKRYPVW